MLCIYFCLICSLACSAASELGEYYLFIGNAASALPHFYNALKLIPASSSKLALKYWYEFASNKKNQFFQFHRRTRSTMLNRHLQAATTATSFQPVISNYTSISYNLISRINFQHDRLIMLASCQIPNS